MSLEGVQSAAGGVLVQIGAMIQAGQAWLGNAVYWLKDTVISWDIPGKLFALGQFIATHLGQALDWLAKNVTILWRSSREFCTRIFSWGTTKTCALRETTVYQGKKALNYSSQQFTSASKMTCSFLVTNPGIATVVGLGSLVTLFYASYYAENKNVKLALIVASAGGLILTGVALGAPAPLLATLI